MPLHNHALYQVAVKTLLFHGRKVLVLRTHDGFIDFPGGRVDESERSLTWQAALQREIQEELGDRIQIHIGKTLFVSKRQYTKNSSLHHVAAIYFYATYESGEIVLSDEHATNEWLLPSQLLAPENKFISKDEEWQLCSYFS